MRTASSESSGVLEISPLMTELVLSTEESFEASQLATPDLEMINVRVDILPEQLKESRVLLDKMTTNMKEEPANDHDLKEWGDMSKSETLHGADVATLT